MKRLEYHQNEAGLIGKMIVIWLVVAAILVVGIYDFGAVMLSRIHVSDVAQRAATAAATTFRNTDDAAEACSTAATTVEEIDPRLRHPQKSWCKVDTANGEVTITLRGQSKTLVAHRLSITKAFVEQPQSETGGPSQL
jgi:Flp pilus assembly protein TadG